MTPALSLLCAILAAVVAWQRSSLRDARQRGEAIAENAATERAIARRRSEIDAGLLAGAWALLHDDKRRGKTTNHAEWLTARDVWARKWRGEL